MSRLSSQRQSCGAVVAGQTKALATALLREEFEARSWRLRGEMHSIFAFVASARGAIDVFIGPCGTASDAGDCSAGTKGSWSMSEREASSWESAAASCVRRCTACDRCRYVSFSTQWKDCSWFFACDLTTLRHDVFGFRSAAVNGRVITGHEAAAAPIKSPFEALVGEDGRHGKRHGKRHGRSTRAAAARGRLRLRVLTLPHTAGLTPHRRVPVRAADALRLVAPSDLVDSSQGAPVEEVVPGRYVPLVTLDPF